MSLRLLIGGALVLGAAVTGCGGRRGPSTTRVIPTPTVQVGACGEPTRDGVLGKTPRLDRADRDLNGDGTNESVVVDRSMCSAEGNCHWNVFVVPPAGSQECSRYAGTFAAAALEPMTSKGDDNMIDVRGYWNLHGGRLSLDTYRFTRGGYLLVDSIMCRRATDDRLECMDSQ
ncbi:MAG: hypothetical protein H0T89_24545 [Deltaproteobacteria bacterium]|nr:hypothetical protein [Deltaproteobacteria bacterium]MDQ3296474.1 hypothetical protein [Myxococcota bacterium]